MTPRSFLRRLHAARDRAVAWVCAAGLAFVLLVLPQIAEQQTPTTVATHSTR